LDLEGVHSDVVFGYNEPEEVLDSDTKYALEGVQADIILVTSLKNDV
jgi:hypothetical protein